MKNKVLLTVWSFSWDLGHRWSWLHDVWHDEASNVCYTSVKASKNMIKKSNK